MIASSESADLPEYERCVGQLVAVADEVGQPTLRWNAIFNEAMLALLAGRAEEAEAVVEDLLAMLTETGEPDLPLVYGALLIAVRWYEGRGDELIDLLAASPSSFLLFRAILARLYADAGRHAEARELLDTQSSALLSLPNDPLVLGTLTAWAETVAQIGDGAAARILYEKLAPWPASVQAHDPIEGVVAHYLGQLATLLGEYDAADAHFTEALSLNQRLQGPFPVARTHLEWGRMLIARGQPDWGADARAHLETAVDLAHRYGCTLVEQRALVLLSQI